MVKTLEKILMGPDRGYLVYRGRNIPYRQPVSIVNYADFLKI